MKDKEFDFLLTPTCYGISNTFIRECEHFRSKLFDHREAITSSISDEEKVAFNNFLAHSIVAESLMKVAHAEEKLHHIMNDDKPCKPKEIDKATDRLRSYLNDLLQTKPGDMVDENISSKITELRETFNELDVLDNVRKQLSCKPIVESIIKKLQLTCIEPCLWLVNNVEHHESHLKMLGSINNNASERVIATVKALNKQSKFIVDYWAWGLYMDILSAAVDEEVFEDDDYITFLQNYTLHYNTLDAVQRIIHANPNNLSIKEGKGSVKVGSKISGVTPHPHNYEEITLGDKTYIMNETRSQLKTD